MTNLFYLFIYYLSINQSIHDEYSLKEIKQMYGLNGQHRAVPLTCSQKRYSTLRCHYYSNVV